MAEPGKGRGKSGGGSRRKPAKSRSSSGRGGAGAKKSTASQAKKPTAASAKKSTASRGPEGRAGGRTRTNGGRAASSGRSPREADVGGDFSGKNVADLREALARSINAPLNLLMLTRDRIEEVMSDAVSRGRMTADDAQELVQGLVSRGRDQTGDVLADLEQLLGIGRGDQDDSSSATGSERNRRSAAFPIADYEDLNAAQVLGRLGDLTAPDLRKVRSYEQQHANRKTVLNAVDSKLA